jgi:hypothetical protein
VRFADSLAILLASLTIGTFSQRAVARQLPALYRASMQQQGSRPATNSNLSVKVLDETGVPVADARLTLLQSETGKSYQSQTDFAGRSAFGDLGTGNYLLRVEKEGFYVAKLDNLQLSEKLNLEVTLYHQQEFAETVNISVAPKEIDAEKTAAGAGLDYLEIVNLPYPTSRDIRNALPYIPGVLPDASGQVHVAGSETRQALDQLDGFNITNPVTGAFDLRLSADAVRSIEVQSSRYSAEYGKGSGGVISLATGMGDDRFRFSATNFLPSLKNREGLHLGDWTPRATVSGPLSKGRAWFFDAADAEYNLNIFEELPAGADRNSTWRVSNLARAQLNLSGTNILTGSFLVNRFSAAHLGLSPFNPLETTWHQTDTAYLFAVKDQAYIRGGALLEVGFAVDRFRFNRIPLGGLPYVITPEGTLGNFFETSRGRAQRLQWVADLTLPAFQFRGRHELKIGVDIDQINYNQLLERRAVSVLREDGSLARTVSFVDGPPFEKSNAEFAGYVRDRWSLSDRLLLECSGRMDWDQILEAVTFSPRVAATYLLTRDSKTKLAAGIGLFRDATPLELITRPQFGRRIDSFYDVDGRTLKGQPVETSFSVSEATLQPPQLLNWSLGVERMLPGSIYLRVEFLQKRERRGFAFINQGASEATNIYDLGNIRRDRYDSVEVTARRTFKGGYNLFASYVRSRARSNAVLDFDPANLILAGQAGGSLPWDSPNRFISWGWLPLIKRFDFAYALDWRDGYPFNLVNQYQQLVGQPNSQRLPSYFSLDVYVERRFRLLGGQWALRGGLEDLTNHKNPSGINNNVDSPQFLTLGGVQHRVFTARIRFIGRK